MIMIVIMIMKRDHMAKKAFGGLRATVAKRAIKVTVVILAMLARKVFQGLRAIKVPQEMSVKRARLELKELSVW
jgi:hypothetical protein